MTTINKIVLKENNVTTSYDIGVKGENIEGSVATATTLDGLTTTVTDLNDASSKKHTHNNKDVLDATTASYTTEEKTKLANLKEGPSLPAGLSTGYVTTGQSSGTTLGNKATAEGNLTTASGVSSHAEGDGTTASGVSSHAEGYSTTASKNSSHAEGDSTTANGYSSHAEGVKTAANEEGSHAEGRLATANGQCSHAEGCNTTANGQDSHAEGYRTTADNFASHVGGKHNKVMTTGGAFYNTVGDAFVIGNGTNATKLSNAFRITYTGATYGLSAFNSSGADYAEFVYPWHDDNNDEEDRIGYFVTFKDGKLYKATSKDIILGITSGNPSIVGNADEDYYWRYERDEFNRIVFEDVEEVTEKLDENGRPVRDEDGNPVYEKTGVITKNGRMKLSENYDPSLQNEYVERKDRKEWDYVGMLGVIPTRDDGTCIPGQFCKCNDEGIATFATAEDVAMNRFTFIVLERVSDNVVKVKI